MERRYFHPRSPPPSENEASKTNMQMGPFTEEEFDEVLR